MRKKIILMLVALLACTLLFASCAKEAEIGAPMENDYAYGAAAADSPEANDYGLQKSELGEAESEATAAPNNPAAAAGRKLIKNITADIETLDFDAYLRAVEAKAAALGGYVHSKQTGDEGYRGSPPQPYRRASLVLRIPAQALDEFKQCLGTGGKVKSLNESVRDETMTYNDTAAHIEALQVERDAMLALMAKAKDLKDLLMLQERVTDIRRQLNALEGQRRLLDDQVALSTVTLTVVEVIKLTPEPEPEPESYLARTWNGFKNSVRSVVQGVGSLLSGLIIALPYLVAIGIPAALAIILIKRRKKRKQV